MLSALLLLSGLACVSTRGPEVLRVAMPAVTVDPVEIPIAVEKVCALAGIPAGIEYVFTPVVPQDRRSYVVTGGTVRQVLDRIVAMDPRYVWHYENGVIDLQPAKDPLDALDVVVPRAEFDDIDIEQAARNILAMRRVRKALDRLGVTRREFFSYTGPEAGFGVKRNAWHRFSMRETNKTARRLLNECVVRSGALSWTLVPYSAANEAKPTNFMLHFE
jgi:hypothetical protein